MMLNELFALHEKIRNNTATDYERFEYNIGVKSSCMDEEFLLEILEREDSAKKEK